MKCVICHNGQTQPGIVTVTLQRGTTTVIIKDVPADVCDNCGEYFLDENTTKQVYSSAMNAVKNGAEVEIIRYAA